MYKLTKIIYPPEIRSPDYVNLNQLIFVEFTRLVNSRTHKDFSACKLHFPSTSSIIAHPIITINYEKYKSEVDNIMKGKYVPEIHSEFFYY